MRARPDKPYDRRALNGAANIDMRKTMTIQINVGDDVFYNTAAWALESNGCYLADKFMLLWAGARARWLPDEGGCDPCDARGFL